MMNSRLNAKIGLAVAGIGAIIVWPWAAVPVVAIAAIYGLVSLFDPPSKPDGRKS